MKFIGFYLTVFLLVLGSTAAPKPFFFDTIAGISQGIGDRIRDAIGIGNNVATEMVNSANDFTQGGINVGNFFTSGITKAITEMTVHGLHTMDELYKSFINNLRANINILTNQNIVQVVDQIELLLTDFGKMTQNLKTNADDMLNKARENLNNIIEIRQDELYQWNEKSVKISKKVSEEIQKQIEDLLDRVVEAGLSNAQECAKTVLIPIENLNNRTKETIEDSFPLIDDLFVKVAECTRLNQRNNRAVLKCVAEIKVKLDALYPFSTFFAYLLNEIKQVALSSYYRTSCIVEVIANIEEDKAIATEEIEKLLTNYN